MKPSPLSTFDARTTRALTRYLRAIVIRRWSLSADAADDLVQTAWLRVLERGAAFQARSAFTTYVVGIAINIRREQARRGARRRALEARFESDHVHGAVAPADPTADGESEQREDLARARTALQRLSPRDRWLVEARFVEDAPYSAMLPRFQATFGPTIRTEEGLRCAVFAAKRRLGDLVHA
ncbi:MAG: sigma-70 family RNA polymerase sigma factor [Deltaproteobacteria bacterium]|nr:sigma-70 family RNA polymerase sigma factor [Deltaproteobacteria bacterium]